MRLARRLCEISRARAADPLRDIDFREAPDRARFWMPEPLLSLHGTPIYERLSEPQRRDLSHRELSLLCSISCYGEKEVIANLVRNLLKKALAEHREYLFHFIHEETNHIYLFNRFCEQYGSYYPSLYPYARGDLWQDASLDLLSIFVHVLVFEEIGAIYNELIARDEAVPALVRDINHYHWIDEGRHLAYGREAVAELAARFLPRVPPERVAALQAHFEQYLHGIHRDFHNVTVYREVGIDDPYGVREALVAARDARFFCRTALGARRMERLGRLLREARLVRPDFSLT